MENISDYILTKASTIKKAYELLNTNKEKILLLVDDNEKFLRTITDGDLRRLILSGVKLEGSLESLPKITSITLRDNEDSSAVADLMEKNSIQHVPVLNDKEKPVDILLKSNIQEKIFLSSPHMGDYELGYINEAFASNWIAPVGPNIDAFEEEITGYLSDGYATALSSGTAGIHLALTILNVKKDDVVFCSSFTFVASANPIKYLGAEPVFIDSNETTWNICPDALLRAFEHAERNNKIPKAVIVVNIYGQCADFDAIYEICNQYDVPIIEDAAESLGASYKGIPSGLLGDIGVFSFNGNKIITTSGGGMLISKHKKIAEKAKFLSTQAKEETAWYEHTEIGYNYRMSNILAGIGRGQLHVLEDRVSKRRDIFSNYKEGLNHINAIDWMPEANYGKSTRWLSVFFIKDRKPEYKSNILIEQLNSKGIEARHTWKPLHLQPIYRDSLYFKKDDNKDISGHFFEYGVCLPSGTNMNDEQIKFIIKELDAFFR